MSIDRVTALLAAMATRTATGDVGRVANELTGLARPGRVADTIVASAFDETHAPRDGRTWLIATATAGLVAAGLGANAIYDLELLLPGESSGLFFLPLLAIPAVVLVLGLLVSRRRAAKQVAQEAKTRAVAQALLRVDVPERLALEVAAYVAELDLPLAAARFPTPYLAQHLALSEVVHRDDVVPTALLTQLIVGGAVVWVVMCFWIQLFTAFGRAAGVGDW